MASDGRGREGRIWGVNPHALVVAAKTFAWDDESPRDGCTLTRFVMLAGSWSEVAKAARAAGLRKATVKDLARDGRTSKDDAEIAQSQREPSAIHWLDETLDPAQWNSLSPRSIVTLQVNAALLTCSVRVSPKRAWLWLVVSIAGLVVAGVGSQLHGPLSGVTIVVGVLVCLAGGWAADWSTYWGRGWWGRRFHD